MHGLPCPPTARAQVIHTLGPQLSLLDNRAVGPEERAAAPGAVAHEATLLALMVRCAVRPWAAQPPSWPARVLLRRPALQKYVSPSSC